MTKASRSLWWRLSWQLSLVFVAVVAAVIVGLCVYGAMILSPNVGIERKLTAALEESLKRDADGGLTITDGPRLRLLKADNEGLWFFAATSDGASATYGVIPTAYVGITPLVHLFNEADIRSSLATTEAASIDTAETRLGTIRVMYGGTSGKDSAFFAILTGTYPIYIPLLVIALPAIFLTVPRIVRRALAGLNGVVRKAAEIDPRQPGTRLPIEEVPKEVVPLIVAFNNVLERLEHQFQSRQRFLIDAAHELRTPIAIMQTRIEGMSEGRDRRRLLDDVARLGETAEQLLDFERSDQAEHQQKTVDLVEIARKVVADLAPLAIGAGYEISFASDTYTLERQGNSQALQRAITNLVRNAIDHGGNVGAISVSVSADAQIKVADEGPGIPAGHQEQIFEPFYRVTPRSKGAGLGLSLVKQIIMDHRGEVKINSGSNGTTFTIQL